MLQVRKSEERGHAVHGWLDSFHTFSFADYYDPSFMGFRALRVINEDRIAGGQGFPTHPHQDMEIVTYVIEGALEHKDTLGTKSTIYPGEVQHMSAGTGIQHSEHNPLKDMGTHLLQIWILPDKRGHAPRYGQKSYSDRLKKEDLVLTISPDGREDSIPIHQDVDLYVGKWNDAREVKFKFRQLGRYGWIQMIKGDLEVAGTLVKAGDGLAIAAEEEVLLKSKTPVEFLIFDLP